MSYGMYQAAMASGYYPAMSYSQYMDNIECPDPPEVEVRCKVFIDPTGEDEDKCFTAEYTVSVPDYEDRADTKDAAKEEVKELVQKEHGKVSYVEIDEFNF